MSEKNEKMVLCLCRRCLDAFYLTRKYRIYRSDPYETVRESCMYCRLGSGYDFVIAPKYQKRPQSAVAQSKLAFQ